MEFYTKNKSSNEIFISAIQIFIKLHKSGISLCLGMLFLLCSVMLSKHFHNC